MPQDPFAAIAKPVAQSDPFAAIAKPTAAAKTPGELKQSFYSRLTAGYDPGAAEFDERHPITGKAVRAASAVGGTVLGLPGFVYHSLADKLTPEEEKDFEGHTRIPGEVAVERLTGARQIVEAGKDYASGKVTLRGAASVLPEALGAGVGAYVGGELAGRSLSKAGELRTRAMERFQPTARKVTGVASDVKQGVTKAAEEHSAALENTEEQKAGAQERAAQAKSVDEQSAALKTHLDKIEQSVAKEANAKFDQVREKIGNPSADPTALVDTVRNVETNVLQNIPENIKEFRAILKHEPLPDNIASAVKEHLGFDPEGPEPLTWNKLQSLKSRLDARLRSRSAMNGDLKRALYQTRDAVVDEMGKMADANGAQGEWQQARDFWRQYKEDFHESVGSSGSASPVAQSLNAVDPANIRQPFLRTQSGIGNRGVEILRKYPQHGGTEAAAAAEKLVGEHGKLKYMPDKNPNPPAPKPPTVDVNKVARTAIAKKAANWGNMNARDIGILGSGVVAEIVMEALKGDPVRGVEAAAGGAGAFLATKYAGGRLLSNPRVIEWLAKTPPEEAAALAKIPGADKIKIVDGLTQVAIQNKVKNLSPAVRSLLGPANVSRILAAGAAIPKTPGEAKERMRALQPQPAQ